MSKWDEYFLRLARTNAGMSKDPRTRVGAVIADKHNRVISMGFNGFARGVADRVYERDEKLRRTIHAEENALLFARCDVTGCTIYVTHPPCGPCAAKIIQSGITRVVYLKPDDDMAQRWKDDIASATDQFVQAGVRVHMFV